MSTNPGQINVLIVDDERGACENLKNILTEYAEDDICILGTANSTAEAELLIENTQPDALFLDIEMPNENAFQFLERVSPVPFEVVFVTAYDEYAIRAFKLNAVDYILKPISILELVEAVKKLKERIEYKKLMANVTTSYTDIGKQISSRAKSQRITLREANSIEMVEFKNILFVEAQGSYSKVMFLKNNAAREKVMSVSLSDYEEIMPPEMFYRIHKSYLINCVHVKRIIREEVGQVVINDEFTLPVSRRRFAPLLEFLKSNDYYDD
jgi:two-component system, LytTR family, response regulator